MAELHYKLALAQQYNEDPGAALTSIKAAIGILDKMLAGLRPPAASGGSGGDAAPSFSFGVPDPAELAKADDKAAEVKTAETPEVGTLWAR